MKTEDLLGFTSSINGLKMTPATIGVPSLCNGCPELCEGCGEPIGDEVFETDDMVVLCKKCWELCLADAENER